MYALAHRFDASILLVEGLSHLSLLRSIGYANTLSQYCHDGSS